MLALLIVFVAVTGTEALGQSQDQGTSREVIRISDRARDAIGLKVEKVEMRPLPLEVSVLGEIEAMPTKSYVQHAMLAYGEQERVCSKSLWRFQLLKVLVLSYDEGEPP